MNEILKSKNMSLVCTIANSLFAIHSFSNGSWLFGLMCVGFAIFCGRNYLKHP